MTWGVVLDPSEVAVNRTALDLNSGPTRIQQNGVDWGDAQIQAYLADLAVGSAPVDYRLPNRTVTIPLGLGMDSSGTIDTARTNLNKKVALLQREGGWLKRAVSGRSNLYADVVNATLHEPDKFGETGGVEPDLTLTLECLPDFYGDEIILDTLSTLSAGAILSKLKLAAADALIGGDHPGRCRLQITDTSGNDKKGLFWGFRSRYYDAGAPLIYEAEALTAVNGAASAALAGASGGNVMQHTALPAQTWATILATGALAHKGTYRVRVRAYSASATPSLRLQWGVGSLSSPVINDPIALPGAAGLYLLDLGVVRLDPILVGTHQWQAVVQAYVQAANDPIALDCLYLQPLDETAGFASYVPAPPASSLSTVASPSAGVDDATVGTVAWNNPGNIFAHDGSYANAATGGSASTHYLKATGYGFSIPAGATIQGIRVDVVRRMFGGSSITDSSIKLVKAGAIVGSDRSQGLVWSSSWRTDSFGGPTDLWGTTWAPADVNNSGFGAVISAALINATATVDYIGITVYYTLAAGFTIAQDAVVYASQTTEIRSDGTERAAGGIYGPIGGAGGDLPRIPPAGLEGRVLELFVRPSRGDLDQLADSALDATSVTVKYRPSYLFRP